MADFDLLLRHGTLIDGSGAPRRAADVGLRGARVAAIGDLSACRGAQEIDAGGLVVAPGFIDAHTHDDRYLARLEAAPAAVNAACLVGHTTLRAAAMDSLSRGDAGQHRGDGPGGRGARALRRRVCEPSP
ncbi:MAG: D-aminoacylase [Paracidovorax wautersii]|uniref:D-aminoacylase n=1 Tax=Paracidovorax wautersii TaxID=1177982 RepID=A0A7V8FLJ7_9BURK|nr:MAG: D-aminoacylase [Paracidovorax wautersii]